VGWRVWISARKQAGEAATERNQIRREELAQRQAEFGKEDGFPPATGIEKGISISGDDELSQSRFRRESTNSKSSNNRQTKRTESPGRSLEAGDDVQTRLECL